MIGYAEALRSGMRHTNGRYPFSSIAEEPTSWVVEKKRDVVGSLETIFPMVVSLTRCELLERVFKSSMMGVEAVVNQMYDRQHDNRRRN